MALFHPSAQDDFDARVSSCMLSEFFFPVKERFLGFFAGIILARQSFLSRRF